MRWLESQRVEFHVITLSYPQTPKKIIERLKCKPEQFLVCELYQGKRSPVIVVKPFGKKVNVSLLEKHVGDFPLQPVSENEYEKRVGMTKQQLHPFIEDYTWKVLDESIFLNEKVWMFAGTLNEIIEVESNALKYLVGVINGLLAEVCEK